jgi:hypothetical protein
MPKLLLIMTALAEFGIGVALLIVPSWVVDILLGTGLTSPQSFVLGRITGAALVVIGVVCGRAGYRPANENRCLIGGMLFYNFAVLGLLTHAAIAGGMRGIALWPACALHLGLGIWCLFCLLRRQTGIE